MDIKDFAKYLQNKGLLVDLSTEPLTELLTVLEGKMLVCPICGSNMFSGSLSVTAELSGVRPTTNGRIVGIPGTPTITLSLVCGECGATPEIKELVERKICCVCGKWVQSIYYQHPDGAVAHPSCLETISKDWKKISED